MKKKRSKASHSDSPDIGALKAQPKFGDILAATDFSNESLRGVRYAIALAEKLGAAVTLLHVIEPPPQIARIEVVPLARKISHLSELAHSQLKRVAKTMDKRDLRLTTSVRTGKPFHEICVEAKERSADLIVIATHGYTGAKRLLLGSTAERVVRHAPCPVLTVRTPAAPERIRKTPVLKLRKILVPIDFSNLAQGALPWAAFLGAQFGAELVLVHVVEKFIIDYLLGEELMNHTVVPLMKQAEGDLESMASSLSKSAKVKVSTVVREGTPFEEICRTATTVGADMIVLTTQGHTGLKHIWLGSTAERVVRYSTCPVLVVRERKPETMDRAK